MWMLTVLMILVPLPLKVVLQCSAENVGALHESPARTLKESSSTSLHPGNLGAEKLENVTLLHAAFGSSGFKTEAAFASWVPTCFADEGIPQLIPHPRDCRSMFVCIQGKLKKYLCPKNKVFSVKYQGCVSKMCQKAEDDNIHPYKECPSDGSEQMYPHPTDCTMYYQCVHGDGISRPCPKPLYFNPNLQICDWPGKVNCKSQEFQSISDMD